MNRTLTRFLIAILFILPTSLLHAAAETLTLDPQHSYVLWEIDHLGFSTQAGKWYVNGTVTLDQGQPQNSKVEATIKIANIVTGIPELDKHLQGPLFFDVAKYPTATFVSNKVDVLSKTKAKVEGMLTLRGVTKPVTLDVTLNKVGKSPITDKMTVGFTASTTIKRSDFGMNTLIPQVGDEVKIQIGAEAFKP
ncbi:MULTISPECIES: YceI family protein [Legionella]|uniref:Polyprenyl-pyrophosphate binding protein n=1 Tax=Legionella drozanskii LLAP-1 TaxID=1212489 RepID=A0A0W0TCR7_9GAMM|nr:MULTISPECIES: YceI family protein [Legionella]KTC93045.1 polyprenyl-pyrophosphate binding protein [Legionella drozanskii LLAP-1]PJE11950.1 MAG: polyisoprenoid-binding protein [Legionella sp.]